MQLKEDFVPNVIKRVLNSLTNVQVDVLDLRCSLLNVSSVAIITNLQYRIQEVALHENVLEVPTKRAPLSLFML